MQKRTAGAYPSINGYAHLVLRHEGPSLNTGGLGIADHKRSGTVLIGPDVGQHLHADYVDQIPAWNSWSSCIARFTRAYLCAFMGKAGLPAKVPPRFSKLMRYLQTNDSLG